jgi:hypothetical protein
MLTESYGERSACFVNVASAIFAGNASDTFLVNDRFTGNAIHTFLVKVKPSL